ncbi:CAP domain-containing protein [uncultured Psychrobacter sp.]|uniref:CAP domain-containing protein n=1 Tax=uncultured Psychrobacter sp. TaxID=259303 RepID=UPI0030DB5953
MKSALKVSNLTAIALSSLLLSACGGGGGGDSKPTTPTTPPVVVPPTPVEPPVVPPTPVEPPVVVPPTPVEPTLPDDLEDLATIGSKNHEIAALAGSNTISLQRTACGLGGVSEDNELTKMAVKHAQYLAYVAERKNAYGLPAHSESSYVGFEDITGANNPFFSGKNVTDRVIAANYKDLKYDVGEDINESIYYSPSGTAPKPALKAEQMVKGLFAAPYHMQTLLALNYTDTGSAMVTYVPFGKDASEHIGYKFVNVSAGSKTDIPEVAGVFTYPCDGVTDTVTGLYNESPSPVAGTGRNLAVDPIGQPIYVFVPSAKEIKVSNVKILDTERNIVVPADILDFSNDPHKGTSAELDKNKAFILPITDDINSCPLDYRKNCGLAAFSEYQVTFDVMADNKKMYSKDFKFKTGDFN